MLVLSARRWFRRAAFALLLVFCTIVMYDGYRLVTDWIVPSDPYRVPQGQALKVFGEGNGMAEDATFSERLRFFYWYGE